MKVIRENRIIVKMTAEEADHVASVLLMAAEESLLTKEDTALSYRMANAIFRGLEGNSK